MGGNNNAMRRIQLACGAVLIIEAERDSDHLRLRFEGADGREFRGRLTMEQALSLRDALSDISEQGPRLKLMGQIAFR